MENQIVMWIIGALFSLVMAGLSIWVNSLNSKTNRFEEKCHANELEITRLREKLWSKEDLEHTVEEAVERVFLRWENNQLKKNEELRFKDK